MMSFVKVKSEPGDQGPGRGGQVVHVRGDSETELDLLFSVLKDSKQPPGQTFRDKNLPPSFFNPPEPKPGGSHSREGSLDFGQVGAHQQQQQLQSGPGGLAVFHVRSHSSPAQLPVSLSLPSAPGVHLKQGSADLIGDNQATKYFVNNPSNAWQTEQCKPHDVATGPTAVAGACQGKQQGHNGIPNQGNTGLLQQSMLDSSQVALGALPQGWEQGVTAEGDIYFINHNDKTTSWYDPRLPKHLQKPGALKVNAGQQQTQASQQVAAHRQPVSQQGVVMQTHSTLPPTNQMAKQQVHQPNHITKQQFLHQQNQLLMKQPLPSAGQLRASPSVMSPIAQTQQSMRTVMVPDQIQLELHKLRKERERLIQEQEENKHKEQMLLKELLKHEMVPPNSLMVTPAMQQQMTISGVDPFLGQTVMGSDIHARQNSGDSGLGSCYSLPRTPEDFLGNVDALDRHDISNMQKKQQHHHAQQQHQQQQLCDFGVNPRQGSLGALDMAPLGDTLIEPMAMDSDELVSTLTDDLELGPFEMQMMDILL